MEQVIRDTVGLTTKPHKVVNLVFETKDYDVFKLLQNNREIKGVKKVTQGIKAFGQIVDIIVNESFEVLDGQNRLMACKALGVPVRYVIRKGLSADVILTVNRDRTSYKSRDYVRLYRDLPDYVRIQEFMDAFSVDVSFLGPMLNGRDNGSFYSRLSSGELTFSSQDYARCATLLTTIREISGVCGGKYRKKLFRLRALGALVRLITHPRYRHEHFVGRLETVPEYEIKPVNTDPGAVDMFERIYNHRLSVDNRIRIDEEVKE